MKKNLIITGGIIVVFVIGFMIYKSNAKSDAIDIYAAVQRGAFKVEIETTGELEAKNSVKIQAPTQLREYRVNNLTIQSIVNEGTVVERGDWIATLDRSEFQGRIKDKEIELEKAQANFVQTQLDTTLQLRQSRDELINLRYDVEERKIILEQSKFEPPATIKQNEINMEKSQRALEQALENYKIRKRQNVEKMRTVNAELRKVQNEYNGMMTLNSAFNIVAPEPGMVIYRKGWDNKPIKAGSQISTWDPVVATLPDLTTMMSKTYVNEVDVRKVKPGQKVEIGLDAYPDKKLSGKVINVANVGEQRPNSDAKVFQVDVEIAGTDPSLRPAMTTSNKIITMVLDSVLFVPLECLHSQADSITYVFKRDGLNTVKQEIMIGETNANDVVILAGLQLNDRVYLSLPSARGGDVRLLPEMDGKRKKPEPKQDDRPEEKTITLPNGQVIKVSAQRDQVQMPTQNSQLGQENKQPRREGQRKEGAQQERPAQRPAAERAKQ
ncbi:MAG: HlyD family efflux transporter periplasmic adaptor subunit [Cyclobacteriaceae bacterium]|nr:HlyD family efflux transporter periplasmic adaptor subunit [Cyclobacteriaceae bacterium]